MITFQQGQFGRRVVGAGGGGATDPDFASVQLLTHAEGSDGSTTLVDVTGKTWTASGATISTGWSKFGSSSILLNALSDRFSSESNIALAIGTGEFTAECWIRPTSFAEFYNGIMGNNSATNHWYCAIQSNGALVVGNMDGGLVASSAGLIVADSEYHISVQRVGTIIYGHLNGVPVVNTGAGASANQNDARVVRLGRIDGIFNSAMQGYIDEFRFTVGVARYGSGSFTPPTEAFPDS